MKVSFDKEKKYAKNQFDGNVNKECNLLHVTTKHAVILLIYLLFVFFVKKKWPIFIRLIICFINL